MKVFCGTLVYATRSNPMVVAENSIIGIDDKKILFVEDSAKIDEYKQSYGFTLKDVIYLEKSEFLMPGLVDTHIHASQYVNSGAALDLPLLEWLQKYTFPAEKNFENLDFAKEAYCKAVSRVLRNGTTTAFYNATIHVESTVILCEICDRLGQRALVGKVCMDQNSPEDYVEKNDSSLPQTERYIKTVLEKNFDTVSPAVVPRFAIAASKDLMTSLAELAHKYQVHIQTHLAETKPECKFIQELYPWAENYTDVYLQCGVLNENSSMAHCIYQSMDEVKTMKSQGAAVSHCPNSNMSLKSGLCDVRRLLDEGIKVGLGTDVSGGYSPSVFDAIRYTVQVSNILTSMKQPSDKYQPIDFREAFRLATLGGSEALGLQKKVGTFAVGLEFDALRVSVKVKDSPVDVFDRDSLNDVIQKFFYLGDDRNIVEVYVAGRQVIPPPTETLYENNNLL